MDAFGGEHLSYMAVPGTPAPRAGALSRVVRLLLRQHSYSTCAIFTDPPLSSFDAQDSPPLSASASYVSEYKIQLDSLELHDPYGTEQKSCPCQLSKCVPNLANLAAYGIAHTAFPIIKALRHGHRASFDHALSESFKVE